MANFYNKEIKESFLSTLPKQRADVYKYAFQRSLKTETMLDRDLYDFTTDEIKMALIDADHSTENSIKLTYSAFKAYLDWAAKNGYANSDINIIESIKENELKTYIDKTKKLYISEEELDNIEKDLENYQDKVVIRAIFEGISGHQLSSLLNLKRGDFNEETKMVTLHDDKFGDREVKIDSDKLFEYMRIAVNDTEYYNRNGNSIGKWAKSSLVQSDYVVKSAEKNNTGDVIADKHTVYRRIKMVSELFGYPYLNAKNIEKSGMIRMAKNLYERDGELANKQIAEVAEQYGVRKYMVNGYEVFNYTVLKGFINRENILDLYGIDIDAE